MGYVSFSLVITSSLHDDFGVLHGDVQDEAAHADSREHSLGACWSVVAIHSVHLDHPVLHSQHTVTVPS